MLARRGRKGAPGAQAHVGLKPWGTSCLNCLRKSRAQFTVTSSLQQPTSTCCVGAYKLTPTSRLWRVAAARSGTVVVGLSGGAPGRTELVCSGCEQHDAVRWPGRAEPTGPVVPVVGSCCHACRASLRTP